MKKIAITLSMLFALIIISCSEESLETTNESQNFKIAAESHTNIGTYKGVFTTLDSEYRGTVEIEIIDFDNSTLDKSFHGATIELQNGEIVFATSNDRITMGQLTNKVTFISNEISFNFSVKEDGTNPTISNVIYNNTDADIVIAKHSSRAPVVPISGTYSCFICQDHPVLDGTDQTFNIMFTTDPDGNSDLTTQVVFNGATYNGIGVQNNCNIDGTSTTCDMESGNGVDNKDGFLIGANPVIWDAKHLFNNEATNPGDCSEVWGAWAIDTTLYGVILGGFKNDPISDCPASVNTIITEGFDGFTGAGFAPNPSAGQLDSDIIIVDGLSDGNLNYGGTQTSGDFARGSSAGGETTGGVYAFNIGGGDIALGIQPGGSDFTSGYFEVKLTNDTGNKLTSFKLEYDIYVLNNASRSNSFNFSYSKNGADYTDMDALDFISPEAADGAPTWVMEHRIAEFSTTIPNGQSLYIRFSGDDVSGGGSRDEFAINNLTLVEAE